MSEQPSSPPPPAPIVPKAIKYLLSLPPLLDYESETTFNEVFDSYVDYAKPEDFIDWDLVWNLTVSKTEMNRYSFMAIAATSNQKLAGLQSLFMQTHHMASMDAAKQAVKIEAAASAAKCLSDPEYREGSYIEWEGMGFIPDSQAFILSLPSLGSIERLLASATKRHAAALKELEKRLTIRANKGRRAAVRADNENSKQKIAVGK